MMSLSWRFDIMTGFPCLFVLHPSSRRGSEELTYGYWWRFVPGSTCGVLAIRVRVCPSWTIILPIDGASRIIIESSTTFPCSSRNSYFMLGLPLPRVQPLRLEESGLALPLRLFVGSERVVVAPEQPPVAASFSALQTGQSSLQGWAY